MEELLAYYQELGFSQLVEHDYDQFAFQPNIVFEKDYLIHAIVVRTSDSIPIPLIQRYSTSQRIPGKTLQLIIYFASKPDRRFVATCETLGVGILYKGAKRIETFAEARLIKGRRRPPSLPRTQIFFCSRQELSERKEAVEQVNDQRDSLKVPIYPMLVETDQGYSNDIRLLWPVIERCMDDCDYVLIILSGEHRAVVDREARRALANYDPEELLFYVKSDKETKEAYKELLESATQHNVKYVEYFDLRGFKLAFNLRLMKTIKALHDKHGVPFLQSLS